ncbi:MAG TPA: CDP-alcohol phosphatidyltransferase family protein [Chloroflexi bacterium]|nr:CDP-alcohol phosphatidyltransferase family protein [Chloroflexota bacterium]
MTKQEESLKKKANPERINNTLLGGIETRIVHWFVGIAPDWVNPDMMTLIGMIGSISILAGYILSTRSPWFLWLASFGFFLNWFGDSTDGNMARLRHIERPRYGYFVDHLLDTITMLMIFLGIGFTPYVRIDVALLTLTAYLMMNIYVYVNTQVHKKFQLSFAMLGPTEGRLMFVIANIFMFFFEFPTVTLFAIEFSYFDLYFIAWMVFLFWLFFSNVVRGIIKLYKEDPPKKYVSKNK